MIRGSREPFRKTTGLFVGSLLPGGYNQGMEKPHPPLQNLKVGDRVRLVHFPKEWVGRGLLPRDTRQLYKYLLARRSPVRVWQIDETGMPWIRCQLRAKDGVMEYHLLLIGTDSGWVKLKKRKKRARR